MIVSYRDKRTEAVAAGTVAKRFPADLVRTAQRKLFMIEHAKQLDDLKSPPGNHLEALKDDRSGQHSIRINDQWRVIFRWDDGHAHDVQIVDYH